MRPLSVKALHRTAISLRSIAAGELGRRNLELGFEICKFEFYFNGSITFYSYLIQLAGSDHGLA